MIQKQNLFRHNQEISQDPKCEMPNIIRNESDSRLQPNQEILAYFLMSNWPK